MESVEETVKEIIRQEAGFGPFKIRNRETFEELGVESLELVEIELRLEEKYGFEIPLKYSGSFRTVDDLIGYVLSNRKID